MNTDIAVDTHALRKEFGSRAAVRGLTLSVERGEVFGFLGPNGAGKTTSIKMLLGLVRPTSGSASLLGRPITDGSVRSKVGFLPEHFRFHDWLTAAEFLTLHGQLFGLSQAVLSKRLEELLELVGLTPFASQQLRTFSKGMLQRIGLAQALINDPELVILDEPTSGLDPLGTAWMKELIRDLRKQGKTVLMCSHRLDDVQDVCDRIAILYNGDLQELGAVSKLVEDQNRLEVRATSVRETPELKADLEALFRKHGGSLEAVGHPTTTLEQLFLKIVEESRARPGRRYLPPAEAAK